MKNTVDAAAFYKALTALMEVTSKSSIEVLREIKAEFTGDQCVLSAADLDTWMSVTITAVGDSFDLVFRNSANIQKVCRHYDGALELELQQRGDESFLTMRSGSKGGEFPVYDTLDCPAWPEFEAEQTYTANAAKILACVKQVKYAVDPRNTRPEYRGVLFQNRHIWALEGHRAGCCDDGGLDVEKPFMVAVPALEHLKVFGNTEIQIDVNERCVTFRNEWVRLTAYRVPSPPFLSYENIAPQRWNEEICFYPKDFVQALKYLLACTGKTGKPYIRFHNGVLTLRTKDCLYKAAVPISPESHIFFGVDIRYMLDALTQFEKQELVTMRLINPLGAISLVAGSSSAIVLPVRLKEEDLNAA